MDYHEQYRHYVAIIDETIEKILPQSETDCSTEECAKLIEAAHVWAAHHNIILQE